LLVVWSQAVMAWIDGNALWCSLPALTDVFIRGKPSQGFALFGEIVGHQADVAVVFEVLMRLGIAFFDCGVFEGAVHALGVAIDPGMMGLSAAVLDAVLLADACQDMLEGIVTPLAVGGLNAIVRPEGVDRG
jgi:hypothetical protein